MASSPAARPTLKAAASSRSRKAVRGTGSTARTASFERTILDLQRDAGNAAVQALLLGKTEPAVARALVGDARLAAPASQVAEPVLLEKVAAGGKRPVDLVALVPPSVLASGAGAVSILLQLHGISTIKGHNYEHMLRKREIPPEYNMAAQLQNPGSRMIAVLPIGKTIPAGEKTYTVDFGGFDTDTLATETVARLVGAGQLPTGASAGRVALSAHSGGGFDAKAAAKGKKVAAMFAFESIHGDLDRYKALLGGKLKADVAELQALAPPSGANPAAAEQAYRAQRQFLQDKGFRFVGFAGSNNGYRKRFRELRDAVHGEGGWIAQHAEALQHATGLHYDEIRQLLAANYQFNVEDKGDHFTVVAEGHLQQAVGALPAAMGGGAGVGPRSTPASTAAAVKPAAGRRPVGHRRSGLAPATKPAVTPTTAAEPVIAFGSNARSEAVAGSSLAILKDILKTAGLSKATITSTARSADDQARAMYQNLVGVGVDAQRALYGPNGRKVIDTYEELVEAEKSPAEIQDGMRDRIVEIGPSKVSRHCGDFHVLNVFDVGPGSLGGTKARQAFAAAAAAEVGKRVSTFIPWPKDPGMHLEIKPSSGSSAGGDHAGSAAAAGPSPAVAKPDAPAGAEKKKADDFKKEHFALSTEAIVVVKGQKGTKKSPGMAQIKEDPASFCAEILTDAKIDPKAWYGSFTSGVQFLGRPVRDPIHTDLAEHLRTIEARLVDKYGGPDKSPAAAGDALKLRHEDIIGARDHPTSAAVSMHLFGLALDVNYTANPFIGTHGSDEKAVLARAGQLITGSPVAYQSNMQYDDLNRVNQVLVKYLGYLDDTAASHDPSTPTLEQRLAAAKDAPWAGLDSTAARAVIKSDLETVTRLWQRTKKSQREVIQKSGFMDLSKELVEGMQMSWGAAYGDVMHFDMRDQGQGLAIHEAVGRFTKRKARESKEQYAAEHPG